MTSEPSRPRLSLHGLLLTVLYVLGLGSLAYFAWYGFDYYTTPLIERPRHSLYWQLKPGGTLGRGFGVVGATMMTLMLGYSLRKRAPWLQRAGAIRKWLDVHIFCGICGPLFIVLHSSFKVQGLVALSFWSMVAVALSGVFGRYLYRQIPRRRSGDELSAGEIEARGLISPQRLERVRRLFHHWHVFHKPFAIVMYLFMVAHIAVAWMTGYGW